MNSSPSQDPRLLSLLESLRENSISEVQLEELPALAAGNPEAREIYLEHTFLIAALRWTYGNEVGTVPPASDSAVSPLTPSDQVRRQPEKAPVLQSLVPSAKFVGITASLVPSLQSPQAAEADDTAGENEAKLPVARSPVLGFLGGIVRGVIGSPLVSTLLVAAVIYGVFGFLAWDLRPDKLSGVAVVRDAIDVKWSTNASSKSADSSILSGEPLKIESGMIELELNGGTKLVVEGPADWSVDGNNRVSLRAGKLLARVPKEAIGFTVETPTAKVVDLGTEFAISVDDQDATDVEVITGKVDVHYEASAKSDGSRQTVQMSAGEAKRFSKRDAGMGVAVTDVAPGMKNRLAEATPTNSRARRLVSGGKPVSGIFFDSVHVAFRFPPSAITDGCVVDQRGAGGCSYWLAPEGAETAELTIDLEQEYDLAEFRLYNTANGEYQDRGTRKFRISTSSDGAIYKTVVEGQLASVIGAPVLRFERFPLAKPVAARYVRFEALDGYDQGLGLNELQVFTSVIGKQAK